jgi:hypothetical protein
MRSTDVLVIGAGALSNSGSQQIATHDLVNNKLTRQVGIQT